MLNAITNGCLNGIVFQRSETGIPNRSFFLAIQLYFCLVTGIMAANVSYSACHDRIIILVALLIVCTKYGMQSRYSKSLRSLWRLERDIHQNDISGLS